MIKKHKKYFLLEVTNTGTEILERQDDIMALFIFIHFFYCSLSSVSGRNNLTKFEQTEERPICLVRYVQPWKILYEEDS